MISIQFYILFGIFQELNFFKLFLKVAMKSIFRIFKNYHSTKANIKLYFI
jgi:hypothetical protein